MKTLYKGQLVQTYKARIRKNDQIAYFRKVKANIYELEGHYYDKEELDFEDFKVQKNRVVNLARKVVRNYLGAYELNPKAYALATLIDIANGLDDVLRHLNPNDKSLLESN